MTLRDAEVLKAVFDWDITPQEILNNAESINQEIKDLFKL